MLLALSVFVAFWGLDAGPPLGDHEAIVAQIARQMRQSGNWLLPHLNDVVFIRKPPLQPWLVAAASYVLDASSQPLPVTTLAARMPSALSGIALVFVVYSLGRAMFNPRVALVAGAIYATSVTMLFYSHNAQTDMLLSLLTTASMACFWLGIRRPTKKKRYFAGFYACLALAMMAKAPLPLALVGSALFAYWFVTIPLTQTLRRPDTTGSPFRYWAMTCLRQFKCLPRLWLIPGTLLFLAIAAPWPVYVYWTVDNALPLWRTEFVDRYVGLLNKPDPFWYYLPLLFGMTVPFCLSLPEALASPFLSVYRKERAPLLFLSTWVIVQVGFMSTSAFKMPHYVLSVIPALALMLALVIERLFLGPAPARPGRVRLAVAVIVVGLIAGAGGGLAYVSRDFPVILRAAQIGGAIVLAGVLLAAGLFLIQRRKASLIALCMTSALTFSWTWSAIGRSGFEGDVKILGDGLEALRVEGNDRITWVEGRPDARICFYTGLKINPLYTEMELAERRRGRLEVSEDLLMDAADRIIDRLKSDRKEYFIIEAEELGMMIQFFKVPHRIVLQVPVDARHPNDTLVVITNDWNLAADQKQQVMDPQSLDPIRVDRVDDAIQ
jgi:4-amino-4-deoxy-L-arabinose transferase-like glycosyltransferase